MIFLVGFVKLKVENVIKSSYAYNHLEFDLSSLVACSGKKKGGKIHCKKSETANLNPAIFRI